MNVEISATNLVRRPIDGRVMTSSGRLISQPPWILEGCSQSTAAYDQWLVDQARKEAMEVGENWLVARLAGVTAASVGPELRHLLSDFLFGHPNPVFEARGGAHDPTENSRGVESSFSI